MSNADYEIESAWRQGLTHVFPSLAAMSFCGPDATTTWVAQQVLALREELAQVKQSRHVWIRNFIHGRDKLCLVCGAKEPCELKDDPSSPCTFEPTPMELHKECNRLRQELAQAKARIAELEGRGR